MRNLLFIVIAVLLLAAAGCSESSSSVDPVVWATDNEDVCEAVLRHQFQDKSGWAGRRVGAYYILVEREEPTEDFLARFSGVTPPVRNGVDFDPSVGVLVRVDLLEWDEKDKDTVVAYGSYDTGAQGTVRLRYRATREGGQWTVTTEEQDADVNTR